MADSLIAARKQDAIQPVLDRQQERREQARTERKCFWRRPLGHFRDERGICVNCGHDAEWGVW